jgi:hypothetical protein
MARTPKQLSFVIPVPHGGRRRGAGRKNRSGKLGHAKRPALKADQALHVTIRLRKGLPSLRKKEMFKALTQAVGTARKKGFAVAHYAILSNHLHLVMESPVNGPGKALQSLSISFAKRVNAFLRRKGPVLNDRYHLHILRTPTEVRRTLEYVLTNEAGHAGDPKGRLVVKLDPFSSALAFKQWKALLGRRVECASTSWALDIIDHWHSQILQPPRSWLLSQGWERARVAG